MLQTKLELRQSQSLVITPQLQQAIKLLQLSNLELHSFLEREIEQNPLIEWDERSPDEPSAPADTVANGAEPPVEPLNGEASNGAEAAELPNLDPGQQPDANYEGPDFAGDLGPGEAGAYESLSLRTPNNGASEAGIARLEESTAAHLTLRDHLRQQLHLAVTEPARRLIGDYLIDLIDDAGYLRGAAEDVAERLGASETVVGEVLTAIQAFDPAGVGARTLAECLALQLKERNRYDPAIATLLAHLDLLASHDFGKLRRLCQVDEEDLGDMIAEIRALNPKPGLQIGMAAVESVIPDILVMRDTGGAWKIQLNSETLPRISVNHDRF